MTRKLTFVIGFGTGYVLGSKAGKERYAQIVAKARAVAGMPAVQEAAGSVQHTAGVLADKARSTVTDRLHTVTDKVTGTTAGDRSGVVVDLTTGLA